MKGKIDAVLAFKFSYELDNYDCSTGRPTRSVAEFRKDKRQHAQASLPGGLARH
jgi:hypothetical protein